MRAVCGLDVHKDTIYLCILCSDGEIFEKVFGVLTHQLHEMRRLLQSQGVTEVTMESTAMYWIPIWRVLEPHFRLKLVNPYFIKQLPGRKSDVKDAQWIAECTMKAKFVAASCRRSASSSFASTTVASSTLMRR